MPTVLRWKGWIFLFYSSDGDEPPHVHIRKDGTEVKIWLSDVSVARNAGVKSHDVRELQKIVMQHKDEFLEKWNEYFG